MRIDKKNMTYYTLIIHIKTQKIDCCLGLIIKSYYQKWIIDCNSQKKKKKITLHIDIVIQYDSYNIHTSMERQYKANKHAQ